MTLDQTWKIGKLWDVEIKIHWTFLLLLPFVILDPILLALYPILFSVVLMHEFGHILMARKFDYQTLDVILLPIGGIARILHSRLTPKEEFWITAAGPLVNIVLFSLALPIYYLLLELNASPVIIEFIYFICLINAVLAIFNLIPIYPMDGGRILRSIFKGIFNIAHFKATTYAVYTTYVVGSIIAIWALLSGHIILCAIMIFMIWQASLERKMIRY